MMENYRQALASLNEEQRQAVTALEGPVLVIAGPGTGKTQLLTTRIAHILAQTDTLPQNILCLTFTESAAQTMRLRLAHFIGSAAYDVTISTYHAFGSDLIRRFPDYFSDLAGMRPVDDLGIDQIFREILEELPYGNPLKYAGSYVNDIKNLISDAKRALLEPDDLRTIAGQNEAFLQATNPLVQTHLAGIKRIDKQSIAAFAALAAAVLTEHEAAIAKVGQIIPLSQLFSQSLQAALTAAEELGKTTPITAWKNAWLGKDTSANFVIDGAKTNQKIRAVAEVYAIYLQELAARRLFDYDDMILRAVKALETNADLRFTLQERYLYILLDEFQDTNGAQLKLVELLTNNSASEGRPNVLAVGDDDQAIYAFQGANYSHMLQFQQLYRDVLLVPLTKNYRSHPDVLHLASNVAEQIEERLQHHFPAIDKTLLAESSNLLQKATVERREAKSDIAQFAWAAKKIRSLIDSGLPASEIAVLAPQHRHLEPLVPFLHQENIPVHYEKRENVLDDPAVSQLLRMSELCLTLADGKPGAASSLWPEVLSFDFWNLPTSLIWQLSWQAYDEQANWTSTLLEHQRLRPIALFFIRLSLMSNHETLETMLDYLIGVSPLDLHEPNHSTYQSPFYAYYFGSIGSIGASKQTKTLSTTLTGDPAEEITKPGAEGARIRETEATGSLIIGDAVDLQTPKQVSSLGSFWQLLTNLTVLRSRLREYRADDNQPLKLTDFVEFARAHRAANIKILNTSPYQEATDAVQIMTAYKAKGMEFAAVFAVGVNDEVWGSKARTQSNHLSLPPNLQFIRYAGATNDERLRLFYVTITRAKGQLYLLNYSHNFAGKTMSRLTYLNEETDESGKSISPLLPPSSQIVLPADDGSPAPTTELAAYWQQRHETALTRDGLYQLLRSRLDTFQLSPTHVTAFTDLVRAGPAYFFMNTILRFPKAPTVDGQFGNAIHEILEWICVRFKKQGEMPDEQQVLENFDQRLRAKRLSQQETEQLSARGRLLLHHYLEQRSNAILPNSECEYDFRHEGVLVGDAHLSGKIDKLILDKAQRTIAIVDYKTGRSYSRWQRDVQLHKYREQLYLYKMLVEGSHSFEHYKVIDAYLEFVESDDDNLIRELHLSFDEADLDRLRLLVNAIWHCVQSLNIPDVSSYSKDLKGIEAFEQDLIDGAI